MIEIMLVVLTLLSFLMVMQLFVLILELVKLSTAIKQQNDSRLQQTVESLANIAKTANSAQTTSPNLDSHALLALLARSGQQQPTGDNGNGVENRAASDHNTDPEIYQASPSAAPQEAPETASTTAPHREADIDPPDTEDESPAEEQKQQPDDEYIPKRRDHSPPRGFSPPPRPAEADTQAVQPTIRECPSCGKENSAFRKTCFHCDTSLTD